MFTKSPKNEDSGSTFSRVFSAIFTPEVRFPQGNIAISPFKNHEVPKSGLLVICGAPGGIFTLPLGSFGGLLGSLGDTLDSLWAPLGVSWGPLAALWAPL